MKSPRTYLKATFIAPSICFFFISSCVHFQAFGQDWLYLNNVAEYVEIGDLDIGTNQMTIEAEIYMEAGGTWYDILSKHSDASDVNYLLRPMHAVLTTNNGFVITPTNCIPDFNECYHIAMRYDGNMLEHYINGVLNSQIPITGNAVVNHFPTRIGYMGSPYGSLSEQFLGYINEVRIWNVARSQADIQANMFAQLPNPTTQTGLLAYYRFNSLTNLQGNATWNGNLSGGATLGATSPGCAVPGVACDPLAIGEEPEEETPLLPPPLRFQVSAGRMGLSCVAPENGQFDIRISDMAGHQVYAQQEVLRQGAEQQWTSPQLSSGVYICELRMNGRQIFLQKVAIF
ncbi:MAG: LamG domain-containing protein [Bacteroidetes bacterium]|nr:MAG: LamG domain-containing protein [Bacteroidota bacterium]